MATLSVRLDIDEETAPRLQVSEFRENMNAVGESSGPTLIMSRNRAKFLVVPLPTDRDVEIKQVEFIAAMKALDALRTREDIAQELREVRELRDSEGTIDDLAKDLGL